MATRVPDGRISRLGFLLGGALICVAGIVAAELIKPESDLVRLKVHGSQRDNHVAEASGDRGQFANPQVSRGAL